MYLDRISILNFKNIADASLTFSPRVNCLVGLNGMGKSNLLEAIHFLSFARPFTSLRDNALIRHGEKMMLVQGHYRHRAGTEEDVSIGIAEGKRKTLKRNGKEYAKVSEHFGRFPIVTVSPLDSDLVNGTSEHRRRLADTVISQADHSYLSLLIRYNKAMESRNRMLRGGIRDKLLYDAVEEQMCAAATRIHDARRRWTDEIIPVFSRRYSEIAGKTETATISYNSALNGCDPHELLDRHREKDHVLGYTSAGIHRDDISIALGEWNMRQLGSQGQRKTFTIALRLAVFDYLRVTGAKMPILMLDDIFDKLDADRVERIMELVSDASSFGQIFVTDTNRKHIDEILSRIGGDYRLLSVADGCFTPLHAT